MILFNWLYPFFKSGLIDSRRSIIWIEKVTVQLTCFLNEKRRLEYEQRQEPIRIFSERLPSSNANEPKIFDRQSILCLVIDFPNWPSIRHGPNLLQRLGVNRHHQLGRSASRKKGSIVDECQINGGQIVVDSVVVVHVDGNLPRMMKTARKLIIMISWRWLKAKTLWPPWRVLENDKAADT